MRLTRLRIVSTMCGLLLAVAVAASPIDVSGFNVAAPVVITEYDRDETAMTHDDFVVTAPYVVTLDVATHVPITGDSLDISLDPRNYSDNVAVMQNQNCERTSSY